VTVTVTTAEGSSSGTFTYVAPAVPTITRISPPKGPSYGGTSVVVRGTNFSTKPGGTNFSFGGVDGTQVSCSSSTECTVITPIGLGTVLVRATVGTVTTARNSAATFMFVPGYYLVGARGDVYAFGDARNLGSVAGANLSAPVVGIAFDPATHGYWVAESNGRVTDFGAPGFVERPGHGSPRDIVAITSTPSGNGYWLVSSTGYVYPYGGAGYFGEIAPKKLSKPVLGIWSTATGKGYFLLASDGGIFNYGNAHFYGSTGAEHVASPVVGMSVDNITGGYWLVTAKGTVYNFNAPFFGDRTGKPLNRPVLGIIATPGGNGYYLVAGDGGVFAYGQATFFGSLGAKPPSSLVVGMSFEG
jgi:hypothetical protein